MKQFTINEENMCYLVDILSRTQTSNVQQISDKLAEKFEKVIPKGSIYRALDILASIIGDSTKQMRGEYQVLPGGAQIAKELIHEHFVSILSKPSEKHKPEKVDKSTQVHLHANSIKNIIFINKLLTPKGSRGLPRVDIIKHIRKQTGINISNQQLDKYNAYLTSIGTQLDFLPHDRIAMTDPKQILILTRKLEEMTKGPVKIAAENVEKLETGLSNISDTERLILRVRMVEILYLTRKPGLLISEIPSVYFKKYGKQISEIAVSSIISDFATELGELLINTEMKYQILSYNAAMTIVAPNKVSVNMILNVPHVFDTKCFTSIGATFKIIHACTECNIIEIQVDNSMQLTRELVQLYLAGGKIISPNYLIDRMKYVIYDIVSNLNNLL